MSEDINPYLPPESSVVDEARGDSESTSKVAEPQFFSTSTTKLILMSACTLGLYEIYWFYKNWALIKHSNRSNIMPVWRALFAVIWSYSCFKHIRSAAIKNDIPGSLEIGLLAFLYFIFNLSGQLPDPAWLISFCTVLVIVPANSLALQVNRKLDPGFVNNDKFSAWNWVALILGGLILFAIVFETLLPGEVIT